MKNRIYIICIGKEYSSDSTILTYTTTKKKAVEYLSALGYTHLTKYGYYEVKNPSPFDLRWAKILPLDIAEIGNERFDFFVIKD